jgi:2-keto-3-deoxy-L-rhamnonate aldolase RhmA
MAMPPNRVMALCRQGKPAFGAYVRIPAPDVVEALAQAGLDYVRMDNYHNRWNPDVLANMIRAAYDQGVTPWIRTRNDPWVLMTVLDMGAQAISISNMSSVEEAKKAVAGVFYPPRGEREAARANRFRNESAKEYYEWSANEVLLSVQIEGTEGLQNYQEIVKVEGIGCIQTGRNDISLALGVPGEQFHPTVLEMEKRIVGAALDAGKQVSLVHPANDDGFERMARWIEQGVLIHTVETDLTALSTFYSRALTRLKG